MVFGNWGRTTLNISMASFRLFLSQFAIARGVYKSIMIFFFAMKRIAPHSRIWRLAIPRLKYPEDQMFPLSVEGAREVAESLIDREFLATEYRLDEKGVEKAISQILDESECNIEFDPNKYFDSDWYVLECARKGIFISASPLLHYLRFGAQMHLDPSPIFSHSKYLTINFQLDRSPLNPLYHFMKYGVSENRTFSELFRIENTHKVFTNSEYSPLENLPRVAVLIPVYNNWLWTDRALRSLRTAKTNVPFQVYVVDDKSTDNSLAFLEAKYPEVKVIRNKENLGFLRSCNRAMKTIAVSGKFDFIFLLNNDAEVLDDFLNEPYSMMKEDEKIALVGSKLVYGDGSLQEAGGIVWQDGSGWNYGRNSNPSLPKFNTLREADYLSGAAILLRVTALEKVDYFDDRYLPAYYEDTDLAMSFRMAGFKNMYCPTSIVIHHEGKSHGTDIQIGAKSGQEVNRLKFLHKWKKELVDFEPADPLRVDQAAFRLELQSKPRTILWMDYQLPDPRRDSGSVRAIELMKLLRTSGFLIIFVPLDGGASKLDPSWVQKHGILVARNFRHAQTLLRKFRRNPDYVWLSRVTSAKSYLRKCRRKFQGAKIIFDTVDLHFLRVTREYELKKSLHLKVTAKRLRNQELRLSARSDVTLVVSKFEKKVLSQALPEAEIAVVSNIHVGKYSEELQSRRDGGLVFVGSFNHHPNESGMLWFLTEVWPLLPISVQNLGLEIIGQNPSNAIQKFSSENVRVRGWVESSETYIRSAVVSVAPLLVGAGVKGKIGEALSFGTPVVTTTVGAEGMGLAHGINALIADTPTAFAEAITDLVKDAGLRKTLAQNGTSLLSQQFSLDIARLELERILNSQNSGKIRQRSGPS